MNRKNQSLAVQIEGTAHGSAVYVSKETRPQAGRLQEAIKGVAKRMQKIRLLGSRLLRSARPQQQAEALQRD